MSVFSLVRSSARLALVAVAVLVLSAPARAGVSFQLGNHPQPDEETVHLASGQSGSTVSGVTPSGIHVDFSSASQTLTTPSTNVIDTTSGTVHNVSTNVPGGTFQDLIFNPLNGHGKANVSVDLLEPDGSTVTSSFSYTLKSGDNFLTIVALDGEKILKVTLNADGGFDELNHISISGAVTPEPSTMALALVGFAGLGLGGLRRLRRRPALVTA